MVEVPMGHGFLRSVFFSAATALARLGAMMRSGLIFPGSKYLTISNTPTDYSILY
jgi:hypothetical protein